MSDVAHDITTDMAEVLELFQALNAKAQETAIAQIRELCKKSDELKPNESDQQQQRKTR